MNKKSIVAIERIISCINELSILTKGRDDNYFYDSFEMIALLDLIYEIDRNINKISPKIKEKYSTIDWNVIENRKHIDEKTGERWNSMNIGKAWELASGVIKDELLDKLNKLLENELPIYYTSYCNKIHENAMKERNE